MPDTTRIFSALRASGFHFLLSAGFIILIALFVFSVWYPYPYRELSGGRELFWLIISVDAICGPLLTAIIFNPQKPKKELFTDLTCIGVVQIFALAYGLFTVWSARPLYLVHEVDRFKVITANDIDVNVLNSLPKDMQPNIFSAPKMVGIRDLHDAEEREKILFESVQGGKDLGERPELYIPYEGATAKKSLLRARPLVDFLTKNNIKSLEKTKFEDTSQMYYLPIIARQDWVAVLDKQGVLQGFLKGDGF